MKQTIRGISSGQEIRRAAILLLVCAAINLPYVQAAGPGTSTANFLKIGVGGRASGMGEAQVAVVNDASAAYWNPAALADLPQQEIVAMHDELFQDSRFEYVSYAHPTEKSGTFGGSMSLVTVGSIQGYDATGTQTQVLNASDVLLGGHWGRKSPLYGTGSLSYGASAKLLRENLGGDTAQGYMMDAGLLWQPHWEAARNLRVGFVVQNVGPGVTFVSDSSPLPRLMKLGLGYSLLGDDLILAMDVIAPSDNSPSANLGLEYKIMDVLALRAGYEGLHDAGTNVTFGVGIGNKALHLDYAFSSYGDLGESHKVSIGVRFGRNFRTSKMEEAIDERYRIAARHKAQGYYLDAYMELNQLLQVAPWYKPAQDLIDRMKDELRDVRNVQVQRLLEEQIAKHLAAGKDALDRDDLINARQEFQAILALKPNDPEALQYMARVQERFESVINTFYKSGLAALEEGRYPDAKEAFERVLLLNPTQADAKLQLDRVTVLIEEAEHAKQAKARAQIVQESYAQGIEAMQAGRLEQAYLRFQSILRIEPKHAEARARLEEVRGSLFARYYQEGQTAYKQGQLVKSMEAYSKALTFDPYNTDAKAALDQTKGRLERFKTLESDRLYKKGLEAFEANDKEKAFELWQKAAMLNPENREARRGLERLGKN